MNHINVQVKRKEWAMQYRGEADGGFADVVWTDESTIQIETHKRFAYRKKGCRPKRKPRYVHNILENLWTLSS